MASEQSNSKGEREISGTVVETLPNAMFRVLLETDKEVLAYISGKMRLHRIKVLIGDKVRVVPDPYAERARIVHRL